MKKVIIWGTGYVANQVFTHCRTLDQYEWICVIDNDKDRWGGKFHGIPVVSPESLREKETDIIVILTDHYDEIRRQIADQYPDINVQVENKNFFYKESVLRRYRDNRDPGVTEVLGYIEKNGLEVFNYPFTEKYKKRENLVRRDKENGLFFVLHNGRRMYFSRKYQSEREVNRYYNDLLTEQDEGSPHRYLSEECFVKEGDIILDVGAAEGFFSLDVIDRASHLYIIEAEEEWIEALQYTFKDYMDKVTLIRAYVSSYNDEKNITLDSLIDSPVNFIKMDIEGNEWDALKGMVRLIGDSHDLRMAVCAYHSDFDQELIESFMDKNNIVHTCTPGYMWFPDTIRQTYVSTSLNKGIIRGTKNE